MARAISQARSGSRRTSPSGSEISSSPIRVLKKYLGIGGTNSGWIFAPEIALRPQVLSNIAALLRRKIAIRCNSNNGEALDAHIVLTNDIRTTP